MSPWVNVQIQVEHEPARYIVGTCVCRVGWVYVCGDRGASEHMHACVCEWLIEEKMFNIWHYEELLLLHIHLHVRVP